MSYSGGYDNNAGGYGSQQTPTKPARNYDAQTLIPVTVKMLQDAMTSPTGEGSNDLVLQDGRPLYMVKLVVAVRSCEQRSTNTFLDVEDGTGLFNVKVFGGAREDGGEDPSGIAQMKAEAFRENQYVRIIGRLEDFDGSRLVIANDVRVISTGDELTYHFLEVAYSYEKHLKRKSQQGSFGGAMGYGIGNMASSGVPPQQAGNRNVISTGGNTGGGNMINDDVVKIIQEVGGNSDSGIHIDEIKNALASKYSSGAVEKAISDLSNEGHIYSTIDESHYQYAS